MLMVEFICTLFQEFLGEKNKAEVILCFHYLICMLLPVLKQINQDQDVELETEAIMKGSIVILLMLVFCLWIKF